jgi:hypothetical protein
MFKTIDGTYILRVVYFGLKNMPPFFQRMMTQEFTSLIAKYEPYLSNYLDDWIVATLGGMDRLCNAPSRVLVSPMRTQCSYGGSGVSRFKEQRTCNSFVVLKMLSPTREVLKMLSPTKGMLKTLSLIKGVLKTLSPTKGVLKTLSLSLLLYGCH